MLFLLITIIFYKYLPFFLLLAGFNFSPRIYFGKLELTLASDQISIHIICQSKFQQKGVSF